MSEHWIKDRSQQRYWFGWLSEAKAMHSLGKELTYEMVKAEGLGVVHIEEFQGTIAEAQKAVLEYLDWVVQERGGQVLPVIANDGTEEIPW